MSQMRELESMRTTRPQPEKMAELLPTLTALVERMMMFVVGRPVSGSSSIKLLTLPP